MSWEQTACILCECNCGIEVELEGRTPARIRRDRVHPGWQGARAPRRYGWIATTTARTA